MSAYIRNPAPRQESAGRAPLLFGGFAAIVFGAFLLAPGTVAAKAHAALHGLCAQRPSHSLQIGGTALPMDARMTGIYLAAAVTIVWLAAARRLRATRAPSTPVLIILASFVLTLAVDGFNALLVDLRIPPVYEPSNLLRLSTGVLAGVALGLALGHLFACTVWANADRSRAVVMSPVELLGPIGVSGLLAFLVLSDLPVFYSPFAVGLVVAAVGVFWLLGSIVIALMSHMGWSQRTWSDLAPLALISLVVAITIVGALSGLRFAAEQLFGLPKLT